MPSEDRRIGKLLPNPVTPPDTICFTIQIPNAVQYRAAFLGQINVLGQALTWDHPTDGTECLDCEQAAQLWRNAIYNAVWSEECGGEPMSCDDVTDCIETNEETQAAVKALASSQATPGGQATPGERLPDDIWTGNLADTSGCDYDSFWSQVMRFTDYLVSAGNDLLEQIELYTNGLEATGFVEAIPVIGTFMDEVQADQFIDLLDWTLESVAEWYAAADTQAARIDIACALFCANRDDCNLSLEETWEILNSRLGGIFDPSSLTDVPSLITAATTLMTSPTLPLDAWILFVISLARVMNYLGVKGVEKTLNIMLRVAADQPSNDWEELCEECPPPPGECPPEGDLTENPKGWTSATGSPDYTRYHTGEGFGRGDTTPNRIGIRKMLDVSGGEHTIQIRWNMPVSGVIDLSTYEYSTRKAQAIQGPPSDVWQITFEGYEGGTLIDTYPTFSGADWPPELRLNCVELIS